MSQVRQSLTEKTREMAELLSNSLENEHEKNVAHLQHMAVRRLLKLELARGWTTWQQVFMHNREMMRRAGSRFRNTALWASFKRWITEHPPMTRVRRAMEPLKQRIHELEAMLRKEKCAVPLAVAVVCDGASR